MDVPMHPYMHMCDCSCRYTMHVCITINVRVQCSPLVYVTGFAKRSLIHVSDLATLMSHNFVCD